MKINFNEIEETIQKNFWSGDGEFVSKVYNDGLNKILIGKLKKGCSIGLHKHTNTSEIIYVLSGEGIMAYNGKEERLIKGDCHYCPDSNSHTFKNVSDEDLIFFACIPTHKNN